MKNLLAVILFTATAYSTAAMASGDEGEFIGYMTKLQYFTHKLGLALQSGNKDLQHFYAHEVEEQIEGALEVEQLDDVPVSKLMRQFLVPEFEQLEEALDSGDTAAIDTGYDAVIAGCNECHRASQRHYIQIERRTDNPYMQSFAR